MHTIPRYGLYLAPPYSIAHAVAEVHDLLNKQFGLQAARRFQVHCTMKGFFKKTPGPLEDILKALDPVFAAAVPVEIEFDGFRNDPLGITLDISRINGAPNQALFDLRAQIVDAIRPFIAPDCDFVAADLGNPFHAHITLAMADIPPALYDEILAWLEDAPLPEGQFIADTFHLEVFHSQDWGGAWWQSLEWQLHKVWRV